MNRLDAMALVCLAATGLWPHLAESAGRGRPVDSLRVHTAIPKPKSMDERIAGAVERARKLHHLHGRDSTKGQTSLAGRLGRILRGLGVEVPRGSSERILGRKLIRERKAMVDALARSGKLSQESVEILEPIVAELSLLPEGKRGPRPKLIDERIAAAVEQARKLKHLSGRELHNMKGNLSGRLGRILRDLGVELPSDSTEESLGRRLIREKKRMVDALARSGKLSRESVEILEPIVAELSLLPEMRRGPRRKSMDERIASAVEQTRKLGKLTSGVFIKAERNLAGGIGRILRDLAEVPLDSSDEIFGRKLIRQRNTMMVALVASGTVSKESAAILEPLVDELSLLRPVGEPTLDERISRAVEQASQLGSLQGRDFTTAKAKLADRLGRILRELGAEVPSSREASVGHELIRERKAMIDELGRSGKLSKKNAEKLAPILSALSLLRPIGKSPMDERIAGAARQARELRSLSGDDFDRAKAKLVGRLARLLRQLVEGASASSAQTLARKVIRKRKAMIDEQVASGKLSTENAEKLTPILSELSLALRTGKRSMNERIAVAVEQAKALRDLTGLEFSRAQVRLADRLGRILRALGVEVPSGSSEKSLGLKLIRERKAMIDALAASGGISQESVEILAPLVEELSLLRELGYGPHPKSMDERIAGALEQARALNSLDGKEFAKMHTKLAPRLGGILRVFGIKVPPGSSEQSLGSRLIRERSAMIVEFVLSGKLSQENAESLIPILEQLFLLRPIAPKQVWTPDKTAANPAEVERKLRVWQILKGNLAPEGQQR